MTQALVTSSLQHKRIDATNHVVTEYVLYPLGHDVKYVASDQFFILKTEKEKYSPSRLGEKNPKWMRRHIFGMRDHVLQTIYKSAAWSNC